MRESGGGGSRQIELTQWQWRIKLLFHWSRTFGAEDVPSGSEADQSLLPSDDIRDVHVSIIQAELHGESLRTVRTELFSGGERTRASRLL